MRKKILCLAILAMFVPMISGCIAAAVYAVKAKQASDQQKQVAEVESKVAGTETDTYKQAEVKTVVQKPLAEVYQAVMLTTGSDMPATTPSGVSRDRSQVNFTDTEPIYQNGKPIFGGGGTGRGIMVTVYMESQGPRATAVYYYPHNKLYENIPPEQQKVVEANMQYRGRQFLYRLDTQANSKQKWAWLRN